MGNIPIHLIVPKWIDYAFDESRDNTVLEKFIFLWFAFNAYYGQYLRYVLDEETGDEKLISEMRAIKDSLKLSSETRAFVNKIKELDCFKKIKEKNVKRMHPDFRRNRDDQKAIKEPFNRYEDVESNNNQYCLNGYLRILYKVRCNLFHGTKHFYDDRDFEIIALATECLCWILKYFSHNPEIEYALRKNKMEWQGLAEREIAVYFSKKNRDYSNEEP